MRILIFDFLIVLTLITPLMLLRLLIALPVLNKRGTLSHVVTAPYVGQLRNLYIG